MEEKELDKQLEAWGSWRGKLAEVVEWARRDEGERLANVDEALLLGAEAALGRAETGPKSLSEACIGSDAGEAVVALMGRPAWRAAVCPTSEEWRALPAKLALAAVDERAPNCVRALCGSEPGLAWEVAERCLPGVPTRDMKRGERAPWAAGFALAVEIAIGSGGEMDGREASKAVEAVERAMAGAASHAGLGPPSERAIRSLMGQPAARVHLSAALLRLACNRGAGRLMAWGLYGQMHPGETLEAQPAEWFGLPTGRERLRNRLVLGDNGHPFVVYPAKVDPAWVAALNAEDEDGVAIAREMAGLRAGGGDVDRPRLVPSLASLSHPLARAWEVWSHSRRAGFALPRKPLDIALRQTRDAMGQWSLRVGEGFIKEWRRAGEDMFANLYDGRVPAEFPGFPTEPKVKRVERDVSLELSPLARRHYNGSIRGEKMGEQEARACARASDAIGSTLADYVAQARGVMGMEVDAAMVAEAERGQLADMVSTGRPSPPRGSLRM